MKLSFTYLVPLLFCIVEARSQNSIKNDTIKTTQLEEVVLVAKKKAIVQKADRTIFDFSEQAHLNSGSLMDGLKKLPGLIISDVAGALYQGKQLEVYLDGRPLNIYSNELNSYLEGMPANAVERVEVITQPGAEFPATAGGAIINIITSKNAKRYLSATYSNGYSFTNYNGARHRFNNSILLSAKNNLFGWQFQAGQNYSETLQTTEFYTPSVLLSGNISNRINRTYFIKSGLKFDLGTDRLLLNYDFTAGLNGRLVEAVGYNFANVDRSDTDVDRHDVMITYQKRFTDPAKKWDFRLNYNRNNNNFDLRAVPSGAVSLLNDSDQAFYQFQTDYSQQLKFLTDTKWSSGILTDKLDFATSSFGTENLKYQRTTLAAYTEFQTKYKNFEFIFGGRLESYQIDGKTDTNDLTPFDLTHFFPNASIQYNLMPQVFLNTNYSKKISLPNTSSLNPNNTSYQNPNVDFAGNPDLQPTIFDNYEVRVSAFEYFFIGYSISDAKNKVVDRIISTSTGAASVSQNVPKFKIRNVNLGLPIPYMLFSKGLKETLKFNFNPDDINFMYIYVGNQKHHLEEIDSKSFWVYNIMSQILLPSKIKFTVNYNGTSTGGNYQYYAIREELSESLDITFSKKFLSDNLSISIFANDVFNTSKQGLDAIGTNLSYDSKYDSRRIGFSLNYKIPTKNKLAKEHVDILNEDLKNDDILLH